MHVGRLTSYESAKFCIFGVSFAIFFVRCTHTAGNCWVKSLGTPTLAQQLRMLKRANIFTTVSTGKGERCHNNDVWDLVVSGNDFVIQN